MNKVNYMKQYVQMLVMGTVQEFYPEYRISRYSKLAVFLHFGNM